MKIGFSKTALYHISERPRIGKLIEGEELKENKAMMKRGKNK
jgi:hypothetical protein